MVNPLSGLFCKEEKEVLPDSLHFVGIGGIGMSGLAQMAVSLGKQVSGSDRALNSPENARIVNALRAQGIKLYPQDGSRYQESNPVDAIVYSTAIEEDNPDFKNAPAGTRRIHRSVALSLSAASLGQSAKLFAVSGTCGKTTVSAWLAEALEAVGAKPGVLCGGLLNAFASDRQAGNFASGRGSDFVIEADESDKSLLNYQSDRSLILNIGTDHYSREELARVFREFVLKTREFSILGDQAFLEIGPDSLAEADLILFSRKFDSPSVLHGRSVMKLDSYRVKDGFAFASFDGLQEIRLPAPGIHNAENALAVYTALRRLGYDAQTGREAVQSFHGVWRRFDLAGTTESGIRVYDDYAHNAEKIVSCLKAAQEIAQGRVLAVFQPHGFAPLGFMRSELFHVLERELRANDKFLFLPVYYAGGSSSFTPTTQEVAEDFLKNTKRKQNYCYFEDRGALVEYLSDSASDRDLILVMGARDNSLSSWAKEIAEHLNTQMKKAISQKK